MLLEQLDLDLDPLALAALPDLRDASVVSVRGWRVVVADPLGRLADLDALDRFARLTGWREARDPDAPPFVGGAVGFITDDCSPGFLDLPGEDPRPTLAALPPVSFAVHDSAVCVAPDGVVWIAAADLPGWTREPASDRARRWRTRVQAAVSTARRHTEPKQHAAEPRFSLDAGTHRAAVERIQRWIAAGDLYQANLTLQVSVPWRASGFALARGLWAASPDASHAAWLRTPWGEVVSVSPETFVASDGGQVRMRPIKGTRPRGADPDDDREQASALLGSAKDAAEHVMIVDLVRNDLGRVCVTGSVEVPDLAALERYPTVWHLTSTVMGTLRDDVDLGQLLAATFPCGSVTGAPKRMACERIPLVEPVRRGVYCGAIGVVGRGLVDLSVAIRTAVLSEGVAHYGTGGGIVADSDADEEWREAMTKASAFLRATTATGNTLTETGPPRPRR